MPTDRSELEPIDPRTAQQLYLDHKATECTESTVRNHRYHINYLVEWCEENGVDNLNDLDDCMDDQVAAELGWGAFR